MNIKSDRNKKKIYFSDAMNQIDQSIDYNEYSEVNSSDYFRETLYRAEDEMEKMMSSPLMSSYKKYKKKKISMNLIKKNKDYIFRKIKWLNDKANQKSIVDINKKKSKNKLDSMLKRLKHINTCNKNSEEKEQVQNQKTIKNETNSFLPKINTLKSFNIDKSNQINDSDGFGLISDRNKKDEEKKHIMLTISNSLSKNYSLNDKTIKRRNNNYSNNDTKSFYYTQKENKSNNKNRAESRENIYLKCIKGLKTLESIENNDQAQLLNINIYKNNKSKDIGNRIYNKDNIMKKFLEENINALNKEKRDKKQEQVLKDYVKLKLKIDPIIKLSEKFAYFNRKPLLTLFHCENKEEKKKNGPLAKLKIRDKNIMRKLENDNRSKNLLMKRLDEDQIKYIKNGYFIMNKDKDTDKKTKIKKINHEPRTITGFDNEFFNKIKRKVPYENEEILLLK